MNIEAEVITFPVKTKLVCSGCGAPGEGSCGCGVAYIPPAARAEAAVKANPQKSNRAIAEDLGVGKDTVRRARQSTGAGEPVEKRVGRDGKARRQPTPPAPPPGLQKLREGSEARYAAIYAGWEAGETVEKLAQTHDCSVARINQVIDAEEAKRDQPDLSPTAHQKLEMTKRNLERKLNAAFALRMAGLDEEVRLKVIDKTKDRLEWMQAAEKKAQETERLYSKWIANAEPIFTELEFFTVLKALDPSIEHQLAKPDPALIKLFNDATVLMNAKRERLTLKKRK